MTLSDLRAKHPRFIYRAASWRHEGEALAISYEFVLEPDIAFRPTVKIEGVSETMVTRAGRTAIDEWVFQLGLVELISYWKAAAPSEIVVEAGYLSGDQLAWWHETLIKSMGEFFYTNDIDFTADDFVRWTCAVEAPESSESSSDSSEGSQSTPLDTPSFLVPVGGGKDSALVLELLEENGLEYDILLSFPQSPAARKIASLSRAENTLTLQRTLDPTLLELNRSGYLNGHTPFSARLAFEASLVGLLFGHRQILVANEYSANEGNVPFHGASVNHQYSKTFEFETRFRGYVEQYLSPTSSSTNPPPEYLSMLRPLMELQIAGLFARYPRFQSIFKSCNRNQQSDTWCCDCAKCLFVFTVLSPFLPQKQLVGPIFPENLFEKASLNPLALALLGKDEHKPFECVGTYEETLAALYLNVEQFHREHPDQSLPATLNFVEREVLHKETNLAERAVRVLTFWNPEHFLPEQLETIVKSAQEYLLP